MKAKQEAEDSAAGEGRGGGQGKSEGRCWLACMATGKVQRGFRAQGSGWFPVLCPLRSY